MMGVDHSANMIAEATRKYPALSLSFSVQDARHLAFHEKFDAVFSNVVLHWIKEPTEVLASIDRSLRFVWRER